MNFILGLQSQITTILITFTLKIWFLEDEFLEKSLVFCFHEQKQLCYTSIIIILKSSISCDFFRVSIRKLKFNSVLSSCHVYFVSLITFR